MSAKPDGGPAFPRPATVVNDTTRMDRIGEQPGMTLRQWYAGMALQGLLANKHTTGKIEEVARNAFIAADWMITKGREA